MNERWNEIDDMELRQMEAEMSADLKDMRAAATVYAERAWSRGETQMQLSTRSQPVWRGWMGWASAGVAAAVLTVGGVRIVHSHGTQVAKTPTVQRVDPSVVSDDALLEQVQSDLSSGVPAAMEPLQASSSQRSRNGANRSE